MNGEQLEEQMQEAEQLIVKADAVLAEAGWIIDAEGYEDYADALDKFLATGKLAEDKAQELEGIGNVIRKVAHAAGAVKGAHAGAKARWADFKSSVKAAFHGGHKKAFDKVSGRKPADEPEKKEPEKKEPEKKAAPAAAPVAKAKPKGKGRARGAGSMSDNEYKKRYGHAAHASRGQRKKRTLKLVASMESLADFQQTTGVNLGAATLAAWEMLDSPKLEGGEKFAALSKKLSQEPGVKDPDALAASIGREKYGKEKFQKMAAAGRKEDRETLDDQPTKEDAPAFPVTDFRRLSGIVSTTSGWKLGQ